MTFKGRDACDIIMKKIASHHSANMETAPISTYHVEYEPHRSSVEQQRMQKNARKKKKLILLRKLLLIIIQFYKLKNTC